jgi:hypothetical protein
MQEAVSPLLGFSVPHALCAMQSAGRPIANRLALDQNRKLRVQDHESVPLSGFDNESIGVAESGIGFTAHVLDRVHLRIRPQEYVALLQFKRTDDDPLPVFARAALGRWIAAKLADFTQALPAVLHHDNRVNEKDCHQNVLRNGQRADGFANGAGYLTKSFKLRIFARLFRFSQSFKFGRVHENFETGGHVIHILSVIRLRQGTRVLLPEASWPS